MISDNKKETELWLQVLKLHDDMGSYFIEYIDFQAGSCNVAATWDADPPEPKEIPAETTGGIKTSLLGLSY